MNEQQKATLAIIVVLTVVLIIRMIPIIIHRYRLSLADRLTPYAYLELKSTKKYENGLGVGCDVDLIRVCNKLGLLILLQQLDLSLQEKNNVTLKEMIEEMETIKEKGLIKDVEDAD